MTAQLEIPLPLSSFITERVREELAQLAREREYFTADDLVARLSPGVRDSLALHPGAIGAIIKAAAQTGSIRDANRSIRSTRPGRRQGRLVLWTRGT